MGVNNKRNRKRKKKLKEKKLKRKMRKKEKTLGSVPLFPPGVEISLSSGELSVGPSKIANSYQNKDGIHLLLEEDE